jgi:hypothetical protein
VISRRGLLRAGLAGGLLLGGAAVIGRSLGGYRLDAGKAAQLRALSPKEYLILQAVARRVCAVDEADAPTADAVDAALAADAYVAKLPLSIQEEVRALLQLVEHGSAIFQGGTGRFTQLSPDAQDAALRGWQQSSLTLRRRGFQALRTLAFVGYWRDDRTWPLLGFSGPMLPGRPRR